MKRFSKISRHSGAQDKTRASPKTGGRRMFGNQDVRKCWEENDQSTDLERVTSMGDFSEVCISEERHMRKKKK